jgi:hypothetical protein
MLPRVAELMSLVTARELVADSAMMYYVSLLVGREKRDERLLCRLQSEAESGRGGATSMHLNLRCSCKVMEQEKVEGRIFKLVPALSLAVMQRTDADADADDKTRSQLFQEGIQN